MDDNTLLTNQETCVLKLLGDAYLAFNKLPELRDADMLDFIRELRACQNIVMARLAVRDIMEGQMNELGTVKSFADPNSDDLMDRIEWHLGTEVRQGLSSRLSAGDAAVAEVARLKAALREAIMLAEEGWGYAGDYFREKWDYEEQLATLKAALEEKG